MQKIMEMGELDQDISSDPTSNLPSARGRRLYDEREIEETIFEEVCKDRWHSNHNPEGKIDLCNDHNNLCEELFRHKINKTWPSGVDLAALLRQSPTPGGRKSTKKAVMSCIRHFFCANEQNQRSAKDLILTPGSDAAHDMLSFVLFSPGDVILCPTPFTGRIYNDFEERAQVELRAVSSQNMLDIHLDTAIFQQALVEAVTQGQNVRAILLTQPHNPLGLAFDWDQISKLCQWAVKNNLWILIDETFVSHIAKPNKNESAIKSFVSLADQSDLRQKLIWIWSVDKDMCLPGLRFAVIHTQNDEVHKALSRLEIIQPCAPLVQSFVECLFSDLEFMSHFYEKRNRLLADNQHLAMQRLQSMGVPFVKPVAGSSIFLCLRKFIQENTFEEEEILWKRFMSEASIYLNPGMFMGTSDAGWFQLIISMDKTELQEALNRLAAVLNSIGGKDNSAEHGDSLSLSMLPAETSRVPDRPSISSTASGSGLQIAEDEKQSDEEKGQQRESDVILKASEDGASASDPSPTELPSGADNAVGRNSDVDQSELHLASNTPPFPASQSTSAMEQHEAKQPGDYEKEAVTSPDAASSVLHSKPSIDSIDDTQVKKASVSSATDYTIYGHQPAQDSLEEANHQKEVSKAPIPEKVVPILQDLEFITQLVKSSEENIKAPPISPRETDKSWDDEKYPYSYTHVSNPADDAALLNRVFGGNEDRGGDQLIEKVFSVFPASHLEWKEEITLSPDAKSRELLYQRIHYASEQRALQRQASVAKKKLSAIDEGEDHLQEDSHTPPTVPSHITDFSFIEQLVSGGAQSNISILPENYLAEQQANHPSESQFKYQVDEMVDHPVYLPADHLDSHLAIDHQTEKKADHLTGHAADHMDGHQAHQMDEHLADHRNAIEFDLVEEFEPIQLKTPSPKPQLTIDLPLRLPLKEDEEVHVNTQFHQLNQSDTQSERIIEIIERIFLDADVVASPSSSQQPEEMPWSRSDSGLAADEHEHSNTSSTADVDLGECHPLESSTLKRVAKGPTSQKLEDSGVFVGDSLPGTLSIDFPLLIPMENEHKEVEIQPVISQSEPLFSASELMDLVGYHSNDQYKQLSSSISVENRLDDHPSSSNHSDDQIADHPPKQLESPIVNQIEKPKTPPKFDKNSAQEFTFDLENNHFKPATELNWQPIESLEPEKTVTSSPKLIFTMEPDDDVSPDQQLQFDSSLPQQYSEAQLLAMLSEGSSFCPIQEDMQSPNNLQPPPSPLLIQDLNLQKKSDTGSTSSFVQKWEPLESFNEAVDESSSNQISNSIANNPKYSDVDAKKFSEDLNDMEKVVEPAPRDPSMVIGEYNQKVHGKGPMPLGVIGHSPVPDEPGNSLERKESMDIDLRFSKPLEEEWLTQVVWIVGAEESQEARCGAAVRKKKSSKMSWRSFSEVALEKGETQVSRFKVSLSEEEDVSKADRRGSSPITLLHQEGEKKDSKEKLVTGQNMVDTNDIQPVEVAFKESTEVRKDDLNGKKKSISPQQAPDNDYKSYDYLVDPDHIYPPPHQKESLEVKPEKPFNIDNNNQQASTSETIQSPTIPNYKKVQKQGRELYPSIRVESTHPIYYSKPHWKQPKIVGSRRSTPMKGAAPQFVRVCCPGRAATPQIHHRMHMTRGYNNRTGDLRVVKDTIVMEHTNITEITYSEGPRRPSRINERDEKISTSASTSINTFAPNEFFDSIRFMDVNHEETIGNKEKSKSKEMDSEEPLDLCCKMRVLSQPLTSGGEMGEKENERSSLEYEYFVCKNPQHAESIDHCDPTRLYTIQRSTMPGRKDCQKIKPVNFANSTVDPARITVNTQRDGAKNLDSVTVPHTPGSNWIVSSVCKTVHYADKSTNRSYRKKYNFAHKETQV